VREAIRAAILISAPNHFDKMAFGPSTSIFAEVVLFSWQGLPSVGKLTEIVIIGEFRHDS
jgi:hypothetical protein